MFHPGGLDLSGYQALLVSELQTPLLCAKHATSLMQNHAGGSIVFLVSSGGSSLSPVAPGNVDAMSALTVSAASVAAGSGVRVNCVSHAVGSGGDGKRVSRFPLAAGREPNEDDVAMQVVHLLSGKAAFVTGQTISADSGRRSGS